MPPGDPCQRYFEQLRTRDGSVVIKTADFGRPRLLTRIVSASVPRAWELQRQSQRSYVVYGKNRFAGATVGGAVAYLANQNLTISSLLCVLLRRNSIGTARAIECNA